MKNRLKNEKKYINKLKLKMSIDYSTYEDLNDIPEKGYDDDVEIDIDELPEWMIDVKENIGISNQGVNDCLFKFILSYLESEQLQELTKNYVLLFVNREYVGVYKNEKIAYDLGNKLRGKGGKFTIIPMYYEISGSEYKEICLFTQQKLLKE